jgi:hypothetical protein
MQFCKNSIILGLRLRRALHRTRKLLAYFPFSVVTQTANNTERFRNGFIELENIKKKTEIGTVLVTQS